MSGEVINVNGASYRVYSTGFMGSSEVALTAEVEKEHLLSYGLGLINTSHNTIKHRTCVKTNELKDANNDILSSFYLYDQMVSLAFSHFGRSIKDWINLHDSRLCRESTLTTVENVNWIKETLEYVGGVRERRAISTPTWSAIINGSGTLKSITVERQLHQTIKVLPMELLDTRNFIQAWSKKPNGLLDLRDSLFLMYGQV